jgi:glycine oxidase
MTLIPDLLVVGGGPVGTACARSLAAAGAHVTLLERPETPGDAWRASAGMLAAQVEAHVDDPLLDLALAGRGFYVDHAAALRGTTGIDIGLATCGILEVVQTEAAASRLKDQVAWQRQQALHASWLDGDELGERWPWLAASVGGFWSPDDGAVDPVQVVAAFRADAVRMGATIVPDSAVALDHDGHQLRGVIGERGHYKAGMVVIAAGAWSGRLQQLPRPISVEPVRGQMLAFDWPAGAPPAIVYGHHCYLLYRAGEMLVGSTMEHAGFDASVTATALTELQARASKVYPALARMSARRSWAGLRPGTPDGLPIIGAEPRLPGLWYATGHGRNGILLAGATGDLITRAISGAVVDDELAPFRPTRFWDW